MGIIVEKIKNIGSFFKNPKNLTISILLLLFLSIPLTVVTFQSRENSNSNASTSLNVCSTVTTDITLVIDKSGSMNSTLGTTTTTKLQAAKSAATSFVNIVSANTQNRIGLTTFQSTATLNSQLTNNFSSVNVQLNQITAGGNTCTQCGAKTADDEIHVDGRAGIKKVAILLTDGIANTILGSTTKTSTTAAEAAAITEIQNAHNTDGTIYFTIGLGNKDGNTETGIDEPFLQKIAAITGGTYYYAPTTDDLNQIYQSISQILGKGEISGITFNDSNNNGIYDQTTDTPLAGWTTDLFDATNTKLLANSTTDTSGAYSFTGLCDGTYVVHEEQHPGWTQTLPTTANFYTILIANGNSIANENFGNTQRSCGTACTTNDGCSGASGGCGFCNLSTSTCSVTFTPTPTLSPSPEPTATPTLTVTPIPTDTPEPTTTPSPIPTNTPTPTVTPSPIPTEIPAPIPTSVPNTTQLSFTIFLHTIGYGGDNANASGSGNMHPLHPERDFFASVYDGNNNLVTQGSGKMLYSSKNGNFQGNINFDTLLTGDYIVKVTSPQYLQRRLPGIQHIIAQRTNTTPPAYLVDADITGDNQIDLRDYTILFGCYTGDFTPAASCTPEQKLASDLNDDGAVDFIDLNIFLRELSVQQGD